MSDRQLKIKAHCNSCSGETNRSVLHSEDQRWDEEVNPGFHIYGSETFKMIKCCGCGSIKLRHTSWFSEACDEQGNPFVEVNYYPPATSKSIPTWLPELGFPLGSDEEQYVSQLLKEIYSALHNDSRRLAVIGARALLEHIMVSKVDDQDSFKKNLEKFQT